MTRISRSSSSRSWRPWRRDEHEIESVFVPAVGFETDFFKQHYKKYFGESSDLEAAVTMEEGIEGFLLYVDLDHYLKEFLIRRMREDATRMRPSRTSPRLSPDYAEIEQFTTFYPRHTLHPNQPAPLKLSRSMPSTPSGDFENAHPATIFPPLTSGAMGQDLAWYVQPAFAGDDCRTPTHEVPRLRVQPCDSALRSSRSAEHLGQPCATDYQPADYHRPYSAHPGGTYSAQPFSPQWDSFNLYGHYSPESSAGF